MKKLILLNFIIVFAFIGCHSDSAKDEGMEVITEDTVRDKMYDPGTDPATSVKNSPDIWTADFEPSTNTFQVHKPTNTRLDEKSNSRINTIYMTCYFVGGAGGTALGLYCWQRGGWSLATWQMMGFNILAFIILLFNFKKVNRLKSN